MKTTETAIKMVSASQQTRFLALWAEVPRLEKDFEDYPLDHPARRLRDDIVELTNLITHALIESKILKCSANGRWTLNANAWMRQDDERLQRLEKLVPELKQLRLEAEIQLQLAAK